MFPQHSTAMDVPNSASRRVSRRLVEHLVRDEGVAGSNPATPTSLLKFTIAAGPDMGNETPCRSSSRLGFSQHGVDEDWRLCKPFVRISNLAPGTNKIRYLLSFACQVHVALYCTLELANFYSIIS
jgi:hypothetical protein